MPTIPTIAAIARPYRVRLFALSLLIPFCSMDLTSAHAQDLASSTALPPIEVNPHLDDNRTRAKPRGAQESNEHGIVPNASTSEVSPPAGQPTASPQSGIVGASSAVITAEDIARAPAQTLQEIIAQTPGVQLTTLSGAINGAQTNVDLRGFGAFATANTLVLINGRRIVDVDLAGVDFSTIPRDSIERIEITKGNSGAVLYGDNAVGGVINIVTKSGASGPPISARMETEIGSFNQRMGAVSVAMNHGPWSTSFYGNAVKSDGYRQNNALDQKNAIGEIRYGTPDLSAFFNVSGDDQHLGLPGGRTVSPSLGINELQTDRNGTSAPFDYANKQGINATAGFTKTLWNSAELIVDGGVRNKTQQAGFFGTIPLQDFNASYVDTALQTWSLTPRLKIANRVFGMSSQILTGIDYYDANYHSNRSELQGAAPIHVYHIAQQSLAAYWQHTIGIFPSTDFSYGGRIQNTRLTARDSLDQSAPGYFGDAQALPLDSSEMNHALHVGMEHRFNEIFTIFGRVASAFRTPNVDERVASGPSFDASFNSIPGTFTLKTQTSSDLEGGFRVKSGKFAMESSIYNMDLTNEIHYNPVGFYNYNLDPTRRYGSETSMTLRASDTLMFRSGFAYTRAVYRGGPFAGNDIPLVSRFTANAGVTWNIWQQYLVADATVRYWSSRRMDNDQSNTQQLIPAEATIDVKLSGNYERFFWSLAVNNVLNVQYYDYAIASAFTPGAFSAYPLPGRTYMIKAGMVF